jgi:hypothetical protein
MPLEPFRSRCWSGWLGQAEGLPLLRPEHRQIGQVFASKSARQAAADGNPDEL